MIDFLGLIHPLLLQTLQALRISQNLKVYKVTMANRNDFFSLKSQQISSI